MRVVKSTLETFQPAAGHLLHNPLAVPATRSQPVAGATHYPGIPVGHMATAFSGYRFRKGAKTELFYLTALWAGTSVQQLSE